MTDLLREAGEALWGPQWQSEMARQLGVAIRTVQRWAAGDTRPPAGVWIDLLRLTQERAMALEDLSDRLKEAGAP